MTEAEEPVIEEWSDPVSERTRTDWAKVADLLRERPGRWAKMPGTFSHSIPGFIKSGRMKAFQPAGTFDATMRISEERKRGLLWVRYVGSEQIPGVEFEDPPSPN